MLDSVFLIFDIGGGEIMLIMFVALLLFGGDKLPQLARGLGKGIRDFKDASEGVKREISNQIDSYESKKTEPATPPVQEALPAHEEVPAIAAHVAQTPIPNTIPAGESHVATDNIEMQPDHFINEKTQSAHVENHSEVSNVVAEPVKEQHN